MKSLEATEKDRELIINALNVFASKHNRVWSNDERQLYERAMKILKSDQVSIPPNDWTVEVSITGEKIFGLYSDGNMLVSGDSDLRVVAREHLTACLTVLQEDASMPLLSDRH